MNVSRCLGLVGGLGVGATIHYCKELAKVHEARGRTGVSPVQNQGVPAVLFCFLYLYMAARGGGDWSLAALLRRKKTERDGSIWFRPGPD